MPGTSNFNIDDIPDWARKEAAQDESDRLHQQQAIDNDNAEPYSERWVNELFDLIGTAVEVTREVALKAARDNTSTGWAKATHGIGAASQCMDQVGRSFASQSAQIEFSSNPFLAALGALIEDNGGDVRVMHVD